MSLNLSAIAVRERAVTLFLILLLAAAGAYIEARGATLVGAAERLSSGCRRAGPPDPRGTGWPPR